MAGGGAMMGQPGASNPMAGAGGAGGSMNPLQMMMLGSGLMQAGRQAGGTGPPQMPSMGRVMGGGQPNSMAPMPAPPMSGAPGGMQMGVGQGISPAMLNQQLGRRTGLMGSGGFY